MPLRWFRTEPMWPASPYFGVSCVQGVAIMSQYKGIEFLISSQERQKYLTEKMYSLHLRFKTSQDTLYVKENGRVNMCIQHVDSVLFYCVLIARSVVRLSQPLSRFPRWLATFMRQGIGRPRHAYIKAKLAGVGDAVEALDERSGRSAPSRLFGPNGCGMSSRWHSSKSNSSKMLMAWES